MTGSVRMRIGIISVVIRGYFGGGDHFDGGDHFCGGTIRNVSGLKNFRIKKYPDTCGRGLRLA